MKKRKIAVIGLKGLPAFGGAASVGENIIEELKDKYDFTVYAVSSHTDGKTGKYNGFRQVVFKSLPFKRLNTLYYYIISSIHCFFIGKYDLIHLHHRDAAFIIPFLKIKYRILLTLHRFGTFDLSDKWNRFKLYYDLQEHFFVKKANCVTTMSLEDKKRIKDQIGLEVAYIPNGVVTAKGTGKADYETVQAGYIIFAAGRIVSFKRCDIFLQALRRMDYEGPVLVVGDLSQSPSYSNSLKNMAKGLDVSFTGLIRNRERLLRYYENASLFVFPSAREAMSMVLLEVASVKTPLICSNIPGNTNVFEKGEVLYFQKDDIDDLSRKISWALTHPEEMEKMANRAYQKLLSNYAWDKISKEYSYYYKLLSTDES